jgi:hypothetical protein
MDGTVKQQFAGNCGMETLVNTLAAAGGKFIVQDGSGTILALVDPEWGSTDSLTAQWPTLYLAGKLVQYQCSLNPPPGSFIINTLNGPAVAYINTVATTATNNDIIPPGSLVLNGYAFIGDNPDPDAAKTELVFWEDFDDDSTNSLPDSPTEYSPSYSSTPTWSVPTAYLLNPSYTTTSGTWAVITDSGSHVLNYTNPNPGCSSIHIPQPNSDIDVTLDFMYSERSPLKIGFRESENQCVYVKVRPTQNKVQLFRSDHNGDNDFIVERDITLPLQPPPPENRPYFPPFPGDNSEPPQWYQIHIQALDDSVHVWLRQRDSFSEERFASLWTSILVTGDTRTQLNSGSQGYFSLNVEGGTYSLDNITVSNRQAPTGGGQ